MGNNFSYFCNFFDSFDIFNFLDKKTFVETDKDNNIVVYLVVPSLKKDDIEIKNHNNKLTITLHYEKCNIEFLKTKNPIEFYLRNDEEHDFSKAKAKLENGILKITIPEYSDDNKKTNKIEIE